MIHRIRRYTLIHYLLGALPARLGDEMSGQAILLLGTAVGSIRLGSAALSALTFSAAIGGPLLGAVLDRALQPGKILAATLALYASGLALVTILLGRVSIGFVVAVGLTTGLCMPAISGGWSSRLKSFTADEQLTRASAIDAATFNLAGLAGPALAGIIATVCGADWAVTALVALLIAAMPMAWSLPRRSDVTVQHVSSLQEDILAGLKVIISSRPLLRITLLSVISYLGIGMLWVLYPLIGQTLLGKAGYGSMLASVVSVSALIATVLYAKWSAKFRADTIAFVTTLVLTLAMIVTALSHNVVTVLLAMLLVGLADGPQLAAIFAVRHQEAPDRLRSQVFTTGASLKITAAAVGAELAGLLSAGSFERLALVAGTVQIAAAGTFLWLKPNHLQLKPHPARK